MHNNKNDWLIFVCHTVLMVNVSCIVKKQNSHLQAGCGIAPLKSTYMCMQS